MIDDLVLVADVVARLAHTADDGTVEEYLALVAPDAEWVMPDRGLVPAQVRRGHGELAEGVRARRADGVQGPGSATRHVVTGTSVRVSGSPRR
ncbi:nuclear transport factor 2 family protein [Actinosynnema sp. NPDC020468]|uniref:nuclear transport factor 2 family protein n=1 Tax=Actinosynnema sp. NPDC020468 TaxID=3154488 RepID=UPI0034014078